MNDYNLGIDRDILKKARETYGPAAQMIVSGEECVELAKLCMKASRYLTPELNTGNTHERLQTDLHSEFVDEVSDVLIVLDHITAIMNITAEEVENRAQRKVARLARWISQSSSIEQTTKKEERAV